LAKDFNSFKNPLQQWEGWDVWGMW
jgi:hypothetical protein